MGLGGAQHRRAFLDFDGVPGDLHARGRDLRHQVLKWTGLPTSVGFGPTKTLAKLANHVAKTADRKPGSYAQRLAQVCDFTSMALAELDAVLARTEVGSVWGVGRKTALKLEDAGIRTVLDLKDTDAAALGRRFSVVIEKTVLELQGTRCLDMDEAPLVHQQIMCSRWFGNAVTELPDLVEVVSGFAVRVARRLREQHSVAKAVHVFIRTSPHRAHDRQHAPSATMPLPRPTADTRALVVAAIRALRSIYKPGYRYAKAGVTLLELQDERQAQQPSLDLFDEPGQKQPDGRRDLMDTIDALNERFGRDAVSIASAARRSRHSAHASRQDRRSPRYTTRLDEIVRVRA